MHLIPILALISSASAVYQGFSIGGNNADGSCRTTSDWTAVFNQVKAWGGNSVRLFASSDCNTIITALPAAMQTDIRLLAGVWATDDAHFAAEEAAVLAAIQQYGHSALAGISVGSEALYRFDITPTLLAARVNQVRQGVRALNADTWVGSTDTWTSWVNATNWPVIEASDMICTDGYPFFQMSDITAADSVFFCLTYCNSECCCCRSCYCQ